MLTCPFCGETPNRFVKLRVDVATQLTDNTVLSGSTIRNFLICKVSCPKRCVIFTSEIELYESFDRTFYDIEKTFLKLEDKWNTRYYSD